MTTKKDCTSCGEPIKIAATVCIHCQSFQDWRRFFTLGTTVTSLLIALLSVTALTAPMIKRMITSEDSDISLAFASSRPHYTTFIATNQGNRAGTITDVTLTLKKLDLGFKLVDTVRIIEKQSLTKLVLDTHKVARHYYAAKVVSQKQTVDITKHDECVITFNIRSFIGKLNRIDVSQACSAFLQQ